MKSEYARARRLAWDAMSRYIRLRDCLRTTGTAEEGVCCTCGAVKEFSNLDAGHFVPGRSGEAMWDERNCHGQCTKCNRYHAGLLLEYRDFMVERYGEEVIAELRLKAKIPTFYSPQDLREIEKEFKKKYNELRYG